ncbi:MAG: hypothetical protein J1F32_07055 [Erysipelotrichales bacterium]|nr:hypothetical protein [Erysipelotrichales bacterium]
MKLKFSKKLFNHFLEYRWAPLIGCFLISYILFYFSLHKINAYKDYEKIVIFSAGGYLEDQNLKDYILTNCPNVLSVDIYAYSSNDDMLVNLYQAYGKNADFLVLSTDDLKAMEDIIPEYWIPYDENLISSVLLQKFEYYTYNDINYGLKLFDSSNEDYNSKYHFNDFISFDGKQDYYLLCNLNSVNFSKEEVKNKTDNGYEVLNYLLSRYSNE